MGEARAKIAFLCRQDFANVSTEIAHALRHGSSRYDARVISMEPHPYDYTIPHDFDLGHMTPTAMLEASEWLQQSKAVVWAEEPNGIGHTFSAYSEKGSLLGALLAACATKRRFVFHAGIAYREDHARYNPLDAKVFEGQLCSPDLLRLANPAARCVWGKPMVTDLDAVDRLWKIRRARGKVVVTHSPSSHAHKGTAMIRRVMMRVARSCPNVEYRELGGPLGVHLGHAELMHARDEAVLHVDQYHPGIGGVGIASFEAMTRGTIPLASTNRIIGAAYEQWGFDQRSFPLVPLVFDGLEGAGEETTERELVRILSELGRLTLDELEARGRAAAEWAHANLSPAAFVRSWEAQIDELGVMSMRRAA